MRLIAPALLAICLAGCAGTINLEPVADKLDEAKAAHQQAVATLTALYDVLCAGPESVGAKLAPKECADVASSVAQGEAVSRDALNLAIEAFTKVNEIVKEVE